MKIYLKYILLFLLTLGSAACGDKDAVNGRNQQTELIFPRGEKITNDNFTGTAWLHRLINTDTLFNTSIGYVTFEPGARSNWHRHPGGQILLVTAGKGYVQERGQPVKIIRKGDVIKCLPGTEHWHGATPGSGLSHIAIGSNTQEASVVWLNPVTDAEYSTLLQK